jgi:hypothetical protein
MAKAAVKPDIQFDVKMTYEVAPLESLSLDPENPRIRLQLELAGHKGRVTPEKLTEVIQAQPGYENLHKQIRDQGGVLEPLIVRHDGRIVEGNSRFAIASVLVNTEGGKKKFAKVPVARLNKSVHEDVVQLLMCNYHISGKTPWRPAAQADQIRLLRHLKVSDDKVMAATRMSKKELDYHLEARKLLIEEVLPHASASERQNIIEKKFHHALEFVKRADLEDARNDPETRKQVTKAIATGGIPHGAQMRKLAPLLKNTRAKEALNREGFKAGHEALKKTDPFSTSSVLKSVEKTTALLKKLADKELDMFRNHAKARAALQELIDIAEGAVALAAPRKVSRRA